MIRHRGSAAALVLLAGGLLAGCPSKEPIGDPAVAAALAKRPDLARNRVWILGLDGCDPGLVKALVAANRLPNFRRLMEEGTFGPLRSQQPMLSPLLWTTVATGKYPTEHGVLDFMVRSRTDPKAREAVTSRHRQVEAIWDIAGRHGKTVGLVGWLASHPAEQVNGFAVSERTELLAYLYNEGIAASDEGKTWPPDLLARIAPLRRAPSAIPFSEAKPFLHVTEEEWKAACREEKFTDQNRTNNLRLILAGADNFRRVDLHLWRDRKPALLCTYFEMLDAVSHYFMAYRDPITWKPRTLEEVKRFHEGMDPAALEAAFRWARGEGPLEAARALKPEAIASVAELARGAEPDKAAKWKDAVDAAYEWTDRLLGEVMAACDADTTLLVVSDHGFISGPGKPPFDSSFRSKAGGASFHFPVGVLGAWGKGVRRGYVLPPSPGARLVDIAPTALALLGFPKAEDMPGKVLADVFDLDLATGSVPTYEVGRPARLARERTEGPGRDRTEDRAIDDATKALTAIGYVGTAEEGPVRALVHMGASYKEQERYQEAEEAYREALKSAKEETRRNCLYEVGDLLRRKGDFAGARKRFEEALKERGGSAFPPLFIGLARIEKDPAAAVPAWEKVLALVPESPEFKVRLADALRLRSEATPGGNAGDLGRAVALVREVFKPAKGEDPVTAAGHNLGGMVLLRAGEFADAAAHFKKSAALDPDYVGPRTNLGVLHLNLAGGSPPGEAREKNRAEALRWFGEVLERDPGNAKALYNRAEVFYHLDPKDLGAAERDLRAALKTDPNYRRAALLLDKVGKERAGPR